MSLGCVATQCSEWPRIAWLRCSPSSAGQPEPGRRLLQGFVTSWKYEQRVRWSRLPPTVARLRSWPEAPASSASLRTRVALADQRVRGEVGVADGGADAQLAVLRLLDRVEREPGHVDEPLRLGDAELHQVDEVRAAAEERRAVGTGRDGRSGVARALVGERLHAMVSAIAATMLG